MSAEVKRGPFRAQVVLYTEKYIDLDFAFLGPDFRYNLTRVSLGMASVPALRSGTIEAWTAYTRLTQRAPTEISIRQKFHAADGHVFLLCSSGSMQGVQVFEQTSRCVIKDSGALKDFLDLLDDALKAELQLKDFYASP